jgi:hypothetical protein
MEDVGGFDTGPVATASWLAPVLDGPERPARVVAVFGAAVLIALDVIDGAGTAGVERPAADMLALLAPGAARVPVGVQCPGALPVTSVGDRVVVGGGGVAMGDVRYRLTRTWRSAVPLIDPDPRRLAGVAAIADTSPLGTDRCHLDDLIAALDSDDDAAAPAFALVGRGLGSTPAGDDMLAGLLVGLHANGRTDLVARVAPAVLAASAAGRTVPYSAALLRAALGGHAALEVLAVLRVVHRPTKITVSGPEQPEYRGFRPDAMILENTARLLDLGHTSGADLATGLVAGLVAFHDLHPWTDRPGSGPEGHQKPITQGVRDGMPLRGRTREAV